MNAALPPSASAPGISRWSTSIIALHWLTVLTVLVAFGLVIDREWVEERAARQALLQWHRYAGMTAWLLTLLRIPARFLSTPPEHGLSRVQTVLAASGHGLLYLALLALPALGYLLTAARAGQVDFFGWPLPVFIAKDRDFAETLEGWHANLGWVFLALAGAHAAVALWHHFAMRDRVLTAMLPWRHAAASDLPPSPHSNTRTPT
ncbi:MAG: cytochrome b/b6 domain-containing protein [Aquabacterium sp.]